MTKATHNSIVPNTRNCAETIDGILLHICRIYYSTISPSVHSNHPQSVKALPTTALLSTSFQKSFKETFRNIQVSHFQLPKSCLPATLKSTSPWLRLVQVSLDSCQHSHTQLQRLLNMETSRSSSINLAPTTLVAAGARFWIEKSGDGRRGKRLHEAGLHGLRALVLFATQIKSND